MSQKIKNRGTEYGRERKIKDTLFNANIDGRD